MDIITELKKTCRKCSNVLGVSFFYKAKRGKHGVASVCKKCFSEYLKVYSKRTRKIINFRQRLRRRTHRETVLAIEKKSKLKNREVRLRKMKDYLKALKHRVYDIYGNKCACCGDTNKEFFAVDHIGGGGTQERRKLGSRGIFLAALKPDFQKDKYQLLCHNCNMSLGFFGYCPHNQNKTRPIHRPKIPIIKIS